MEVGATINDWKYTSSWVIEFKKRYVIKVRESGFIRLRKKIWAEFHAIQVAIVDYEARNMYNMGEIGLFFKLVQN